MSRCSVPLFVRWGDDCRAFNHLWMQRGRVTYRGSSAHFRSTR